MSSERKHRAPVSRRRVRRRARARLAGGLRILPSRPRDRIAALVTAAALIAAAVIVLVTGGAEHHTALPPTPASPSARPSTSLGGSSAPGDAQDAYRCPRATLGGGGSTPAQVCIPALHVASSVMSLGLNRDHTVQVPPLSRVREAGWYRYSAPPGEVGPTVILGHVDSARYGDGIFFHLARLRAGDQVRVTRDDGRVAVYRIDDVTQVSKKKFPTDEVYGGTSGPAVRLVTCGGRFNASTGSYEDNIIAYGTLQTITAA